MVSYTGPEYSDEAVAEDEWPRATDSWKTRTAAQLTATVLCWRFLIPCSQGTRCLTHTNIDCYG